MAHYKTVRERVLWEYAKLIARSATGSQSGDHFWRFTVRKFGELRDGQIQPSAVLRENKLLVECGWVCAYCTSSETALHWEHIVPLSKGGPDSIDNLVLACRDCNLAKGARDPIEWYGEQRDEIPRLVMGKLLKLLLDAHDMAGTLDDASYPHVDSGLRLAELTWVFSRP